MKLSPTEMRNERTMGISHADTATMLKLINDENRRSVEAVDAAIPQIARAVDVVAVPSGSITRLLPLPVAAVAKLPRAERARNRASGKFLTKNTSGIFPFSLQNLSYPT